MTPIIVSVVAMGVVLAVMILRLARDVDALRRGMARDFADLRARMARIEGLFAGLRPAGSDGRAELTTGLHRAPMPGILSFRIRTRRAIRGAGYGDADGQCFDG